MRSHKDNLSNEVAAAKNAAQILHNAIAAVGHTVETIQEVSPRQAAALSEGPARMLVNLHQYITLATGYADAWAQSINTAMQADRLH